MNPSGLVRVTVASGMRRVDLLLPGAVPVAELVPELVRSVGLLDPAKVHAGYQVVTAGGRRLAAEVGLTPQGVEDGGLLMVSAEVEDEPPRLYDDVVEAMADVVERDLELWRPGSGRRTALATACLLMALGASALLVHRGALLAAVAAATVAVALLAGTVVLSRAHGESEAAVAVGWVASTYAGVAGLLVVTDESVFAVPFAAAGGGAALVGGAGLLGVREGRALLIPPVVVGAVLLAAGLVVDLAGVDHRVVLTAALVMLVLAGSLFPWLALSATGTDVGQLHTLADVTAEPIQVDRNRVHADAQVAHEILVAITGTLGLLLVVVAPFAVDLGLAGTLTAAVACLVVMLRTRQYRTRPQVLTGLTSGVAGLLAVAAAVLWLHPTWRPTAAVVLAATGAGVLALTLVPGQSSLCRGRLGDLAESVCLLALLPLAVVATGVFQAVRG